MMTIHVDDASAPQFPPGWSPATDPIFDGEVVIWVLTEDE